MNSNAAQKTRAPAGRSPIKTGLALAVLACGLCVGAGCYRSGVWPPPVRAQYDRRPADATGALNVATIDRILGLLCQTMGNLDQEAAHFEGALAPFPKSETSLESLSAP